MSHPGLAEQPPQGRDRHLAKLPRRDAPELRIVEFHRDRPAVADLAEPTKQLVGRRRPLARQNAVGITRR